MLSWGFSAPEQIISQSIQQCIQLLFPIGYFVAVYSPCRFLHLLNIRHPDLICHSLFLTGKVSWTQSPQVCSDLSNCLGAIFYLVICSFIFSCSIGNNKTAAVLPPSPLQSLPGSLILDCSSGKVYRATLDQSYLMGFLWNAQLDCEKMAALHCALSCDSDPGFPEQVRRLLRLKNWQQMIPRVLTQCFKTIRSQCLLCKSVFV